MTFTPAAPPKPVRLADYRPPDFAVDAVQLNFALDPGRTIVRARLSIRRGPEAAPGAPLILQGEAIELLNIALDDTPLGAGRYSVSETALTIDAPPEAFTLDIETACAPEGNTALSGLYLSNGMFCTQCEAEGFRRITYFLDRPDNLSRFHVRIEANRERYPVLLANGNLLASGALPDGRHFAEWEDPFPKPSYLFALVAGDLKAVEDEFTTRSGRTVALKVFVQPQNTDKCAYTLDSLKRAMRWDEEAFGREYDLDTFMIVAVDHFNFGAMENKGLNIFNAAYVLASPETATDSDYEAIESIVAHEYFHNWSGNRVTCRDWFQLCLKEGFTVFRDQEFSAAMRSPAVQRIKDVRRLLSAQFPEDSGPLAHAVRPESYLTIDNFYTATIYEKGAELCRMLKILLGPERFRRACDLYFARHDGQAATVEDFVAAMEDASGRDLTQFRRWYSDAGTPTLEAREERKAGTIEITLAQSTPPTPGQSEKPARHLPIAYAIYGAETGAMLDRGMIEMRAESMRAAFGPYPERPIASLLASFSAPVILKRDLSLDDRLFLAERDEDLFNRWSLVDGLWRAIALGLAGAAAGDEIDATASRFARALGASLDDARAEPALVAELLRCPSASELMRGVSDCDPSAIVAGRRAAREGVAAILKPALASLYERMQANAPFEPSAAQAGERALKNAALSLLVAGGDAARALQQAKASSSMTDEAAATAALASVDRPERIDALARFYDRWKDDALVVNKWLSWRALAPGAGAVEDLAGLLGHPAFDRRNPNRVRALIGAFARENIAAFHRADGAGYRFLVDEILTIDAVNPQLAARLTTAFESWRTLEPLRRDLACAELERLERAPGLSTNTIEIATRLLGD